MPDSNKAGIKFCAQAACPADECVECQKKRKQRPSFQAKLRAALTKK